MNKKICLLTTSLSSGGAEKMVANMSIALSKAGYDITIFSMKDEIHYKYKGNLYNFGLDKSNLGKAKAFFKFRTFFRTGKFDFIIDHRLRDNFCKEILFSKFIFNRCKVIYCVHSYRLKYYFPFRVSFLAKFQHVKKRIFVSVSREIKDRIKRDLNIDSITIHNFLNFEYSSSVENSNERSKQAYILGIGRLTETKQFDVLINCYEASDLIERNIKLLILGNGPCRNQLVNLVKEKKLESFVEILRFRKDPIPLIKDAKALVLSSKVEGFPMVLLEALALNVPVVSFNCKSGPSEIIHNGVNGILVEDQNKEKFVEALNKLLDKDFYDGLKNNTWVGLESFSEETILYQWEKLFTQM
ncbi:glycosyltransferase [Seonamhaeicola marinus]|uniref:Glycosyltransferase family 4 protein n=1 Tax=Seonamhaeicola marinus TaxID=1912246 RepID=A0A5D0IYW7_9FLAO|nr:glycosyltransferase [Seonamhaeicola marinus]TYA86792.1 glycosyltransferase family 4 protein [Seonamhaeicola marinus]